VRLVEAYNELGATYRDRARLAQQHESQFVEAISLQAIQFLKKAIQLSEEHRLPVWYVDSCEDIAQVHFTRRDYEAARSWLQRAEERVPDEYRFREDKCREETAEEQCVEMFWLQMGKIELLRGNIVFDEGTDGGQRPANRDLLRETARHYLLSVTYFGEFSERAVGVGATFRQMYDRFKGCAFADLRYLQEETPKIAEQYNIDLARFGSFFEDTLGLALEQP
jgi:tetratricopeptide (TPR) repeat protein